MKNGFLFFVAGLMILAMVGCVKKEAIQSQEPSVLLKSAAIQSGYDMVPNELLIKFKAGRPVLLTPTCFK